MEMSPSMTALRRTTLIDLLSNAPLSGLMQRAATKTHGAHCIVVRSCAYARVCVNARHFGAPFPVPSRTNRAIASGGTSRFHAIDMFSAFRRAIFAVPAAASRTRASSASSTSASGYVLNVSTSSRGSSAPRASPASTPASHSVCAPSQRYRWKSVSDGMPCRMLSRSVGEMV
ncbi:hypothetical protein K438DRAFT_1703938 [Mycena galopus ATCC 62051]|nr:hypothetical protein K438DRAFT_1703938 [Mycena galopus ATCC 62051]